MIRLQIQLDERQRRALRDTAHREGRSEAAVVRDALDRYLHDPRLGAGSAMLAALSHAGRHRSGCTDVSTRHDDYLAEAVSGER